MNVVCQLSQGISSLKNLQFSLITCLSFLGIVTAYIYLGPVKMIIHRTISIINSIFGLIGAGMIALLFLISKFLC